MDATEGVVVDLLAPYQRGGKIGLFGGAGVVSLCLLVLESGVIKLDDKQTESKCALVYGQMNEPPGAHARVGLTGLTMGEHFRDIKDAMTLIRELKYNVFGGWSEGVLNFPPTYKYEVNSYKYYGEDPKVSGVGNKLNDSSFPHRRQLVSDPGA
ncbi:hypothetical protein JHK84_037116 [Glycine max]|nr:hypothetical protein JHK84_037116 [Glycine max]